ncbi:hypothetical protein AVEN_186116-1 [Araneus ventricosus]|uniref:Uncharacterized protein n=1 Tax=Araneus ventricosus TaxID=182803 RepID=A0A4Y2K6M3_ARAVE|nr:hypothetical protein AVEN_186116-1 [Araneus ventricosus]
MLVGRRRMSNKIGVSSEVESGSFSLRLIIPDNSTPLKWHGTGPRHSIYYSIRFRQSFATTPRLFNPSTVGHSGLLSKRLAKLHLKPASYVLTSCLISTFTV